MGITFQGNSAKRRKTKRVTDDEPIRKKRFKGALMSDKRFTLNRKNQF
jgi:hypothetical protein